MRAVGLFDVNFENGPEAPGLALPQFRCNFLNPVDSTRESARAWKMSKRILPLIPPSLVVDHFQQSKEAIWIDCRFRSTGAKCPECRKASNRIHSRYERRLADLPWQGRTLTITLNVQRLRCSKGRCRRRIFTENWRRDLALFVGVPSAWKTSIAASASRWGE